MNAKNLKERKLRDLRYLLRTAPNFSATRREFLAYVKGFRQDRKRARRVYKRFTHLSVTQAYGTGSPTQGYHGYVGLALQFKVAGCIYTLNGDYIEGVKFYKRLARLAADRFLPAGADLV